MWRVAWGRHIHTLDQGGLSVLQVVKVHGLMVVESSRIWHLYHLWLHDIVEVHSRPTIHLRSHPWWHHSLRHTSTHAHTSR